MIRMSLYLFLILSLSMFIFSCESPSDSEDQEKEVVLKGQVIDLISNTPIDSAVVRLRNYTPKTTIFTDSSGRFSFTLVTKETFEIRIHAYKESFLADSVTVLVVPGRTVNIPLLKLSPTQSTFIPSGEAASIILAGITNTAIGVQQSGAPEATELTFEVQDSMGIPIDLQHTVTVYFELGSAPQGGEFLHPLSAQTANDGKVTVNLFSGIVSGVVQVLAKIVIDNNTILSQPVAVAIHGGLPDSTHFSLAVEKVNFPGYNIYGLIDIITAFVGDKYANPVKPETAVYFTSTGGLIVGSALTNDHGEASVDLISAAPQPFHPIWGAGFATVTGRTADEDQNTIEADIIVLFSGLPYISVTPTSISIPNGGSQTFYYQVEDQNENPLAEGTSINVAVETGDVEAVGDINLQLPDTQSPAWTNFNFTLVDADPDTILPNYVTVKISADGPNGAAQLSLSGISN